MIFGIKEGVLVAFLFALVFFIYLLFQTVSFKSRIYYALSRGDEKKGALYALGPGLLPWAKESASRHLGVYLIGIAYHTGIGAGFVFLAASLFDLNISPLGRLLLAIFTAVGFISGLGLFFRRLSQKSLRFISCPDDYLANLLVDLFLGLAFSCLLGWISTVWFFLGAIVLFFYLPLGKIRHCIFFFISRVFFGRFFGRRGVLPQRELRPGFSGERR